MSLWSLSLTIGAALSASWRTTMRNAMRGIEDVEGGMERLQARMVDVGQAWASVRTLNALRVTAENEEHDLAQIGITAGMSAQQVEELRQTLRRLSGKEETNQSMDKLVQAYKTLASTGLTDKITDQRKMETILRSIGRTATAATADIDDVSRMAFTLVDTLGVAPDDLAKELDRLAFAGKKGAFELRDMAQYFPTLGAAAREAGMTGTEGIATLGASLQIALKGAGSSGEAANNMKNFLAKMMSPDVMKNFKERGVDVTKVIAEAMKNGENPIEAMLKKTDAMLGTDAVKRKARLGALFGDMQVQDFIRPMLANMEGYKELKAEIMTASGTVDADYGTILATSKEKSVAFSNALDKAGRSVGKALLPPLNLVLGALTPVADVIGTLIDHSPTLTLAVTTLGAGFMIIPPVLRTGAFAMRLMGVSSLFAAGGFRAIGAAIAANPIGLAVTAIAIGASLIYDNWEPISAFFSGLWDSAIDAGKRFVDWLMDFAQGDYVQILLGPLKLIGAIKDTIVGLATGEGLDTSKISTVVVEQAQAIGRVVTGDGRTGPAAPMPGDGVTQAQAALLAQSGQMSRGDAAASLQQASTAAATGKVSVEVSLTNLPPGSRVATDARGAAVSDIDTRTGYQMAGP